MMTVKIVIGQRERNHDPCGEIRIVKTAIIRGGRERKSTKCMILNIILKIVQENIKNIFKIIAEAEQQYQHPELEQYPKQKARRKKRENV